MNAFDVIYFVFLVLIGKGNGRKSDVAWIIGLMMMVYFMKAANGAAIKVCFTYSLAETSY